MDSFFGIGVFELFLIAVIALVVLGPERLPGAMRTLAGYARQIRNMGSDLTSQFSEEIKMLEEMDPRRIVNEVLDPVKAAPPANKTPLAKPAAATSSAAKSAAATAAVKTPPKVAEASDNSILPPVATPATASAEPVNSTPPPDAASQPAPSGDATPAQVEETR
jgi:sec-independent protein translocase protein TatB